MSNEPPIPLERQIAKSISFFRCIGRLKHTHRQGWVERSVTPQPPEAVASHMWRMAVMAMLFPSHTTTTELNAQLLDRDRMIRMALVHDMCEAIVGDATPAMKIPKCVKAAAEDEAVTSVLAPLLPMICGKEIVDLFHEYEENATPEAQFVHDLDVLDMILQAVDYKRQSDPETTDLLCFMDSAQRIKHPFLRKVSEHVVDLFYERTPEEEVAVPQPNILK
eukprot:PhM_4_TR9222/c1_g1_i1/m.20815/K07023/K07023; putative hydrolases of HD superfamily